jgi:hypothetical protein
VERQQLKWFAYAVAMVLAGQLFGPLMQALGAQGNWVWIPVLVAIAGIPISIGIAILRYRLHDIDRLSTGPWSMGCSARSWAASMPPWCWLSANCSAA